MMADVDSNGSSSQVNGYHLHNGDTPGKPFSSRDLHDYLSRLLVVTLDARIDDLEAPGNLLSHDNAPETIQRCSRFLSDTSTALYAQKVSKHSDSQNGANPTSFSYHLTLDLPISQDTVACLAILKRPQPLDLDRSLSDQLQIVNLPGLNAFTSSSTTIGPTTSPYELLYSVVRSALAPYFDALARSQDAASLSKPGTDTDQRLGIPGAKKKIAELELSLLQLQQNAEIPQLFLPLHPVIQTALDQAHEQHIAPSLDLIPKTQLADSQFHNSLQSLINSWIKSIQTVTRASRDPTHGTAAQEINFWLDMESALDNIDLKLRSDGVQLSIEVLKSAKRFMATFSFGADTGLKDAMDLVQKYNSLMREFPLPDLLSATSLDKVQDALDNIFNHINKKLRICPYPIKRAMPLVEAISGDLDTRIHALLNGRLLMQISFDDFQTIIRTASAVWRTWEEHVKEFTNVIREITRRRNEKYIPIKISFRHAQTQDRLKYVSTFRTNHEQLQQMISTVLSFGHKSDGDTRKVDPDTAAMVDELGDFDAVEEVSQAYSSLKGVDVLDVSPAGTMAWDRAEGLYNERTSRIENSIIARLRDRLATARTANDMFRVFSKFNALLVRPKIRGAIAEYQSQLLENVKADISALQDRFKEQYGHSQAYAMAQLHDMPPVSGAIIWARQIERQLDSYMSKVEDVLGSQWTMHAEGQKLKTESDNFRRKLDTKVVYQTWLQDTTRRNIAITGRLFNISRNRAAGNVLEIAVNFDPHVITLFKEVRNLLHLNFSIPNAISNASKEARRVYPYAVSMVETVRTFLQTSQAIVRIPEVSTLLSGYQQNVQALIAKGMPLKWESLAHEYDLYTTQAPGEKEDNSRADSLHVQFIRDFASSVSTLEAKTATLSSSHELIQQSVARLRSCPYDFDAFQTELAAIQAAVDRLSLETFTNLEQWVSDTNSTIQEILLARLEDALSDWVEMFQNPGLNDEGSRPTSSCAQDFAPVLDRKPRLERLMHEVIMRNQSIYLEPPLEFARCSILSQLQEWLGHACDQRKIQASRFDIRAQAAEQHKAHYSELLNERPARISSIYQMVDQCLHDVREYVDKWLRFQSLWDLQSDQVYDTLGDDLSQWLALLHDIRSDRSTFESSPSRHQLGLLTVNYEHVQQKINDKYDSWQNEVLAKFCLKLGSHMSEVLTDMESTRQQLEAATLESSSTIQAVTFITTVQTATRKVNVWEPQVDNFRQGQAALARQRSTLPKDAPSVQHVEDEWNALNDILKRKQKAVDDQTDALRTKISAEDKALVKKISDLKNQWSEDRPVSGSIPPTEASQILSSFESKLTKLSNEYELVTKAKEALDLPASTDAGLSAVLEELPDFKSVWANLSTVWTRVDELRDMPWTSVQPRKLRHSLEGLISSSKEMPSRMRQYAAFDYFQQHVQKLIKVNTVLSDLRSDAVRERHWNKIFKSLRPNKRYSQLSMTLGDVWELKLAESEKIIREVITQAQGEMALEEYLRQVRETWQNYALELVAYQNKCRLIRGWDELFAKCSDNLNSLQAMRHSPYYKEFEEEASSWEDKLNRIYVLFDVWIDVQRQWVYLEGVFSGNADIKHLLPMESSRFQNINSEFFAVMKKVQRSPFILDVLGISGVQKSLERLVDLLNKIQKALGEYLERERSSFPRFYFVGDEDLLEIIGNSNDTGRVARHLGKMFAGLSAVVMGDETTIVGFRSAQGEEVALRQTVSLIQTPKVNEWLAALEDNMRTTLAELLAEAIDAFPNNFDDRKVDNEALKLYLGRYPLQIAVLAGQAWWTQTVEGALDRPEGSLDELHTMHLRFLEHLASLVIEDLDPTLRKKCEHLVTEFVFQRDVIEKLMKNGVDSSNHYLWLLQMRYVYSPSGDFVHRLEVKMANASLYYGFEYLGVTERLVRTPLSERCFLTMTQALCQRLGGSPYGPAGTGKTETVKALGLQLGRFTLVFCCDDTFDFQAMGRIFLGICQVGAWGCFDEFNRLEERILSAVSQQIQNIQLGLKRSITDGDAQIELVGRQLQVNSRTGIFITMNPGYAGRSNLPDNLKKLFRSVAMSKPDKELIAEVTLYSQGFSQARDLSRHVVPFFDACLSRLSKQPHYDFGLRALKSVLISSGALKRLRMREEDGHAQQALVHSEPQIIVQSLRETISPKLIKEDTEMMETIEAESFPGIEYIPAALDSLVEALEKTAQDRRYVFNEAWKTKTLQLFQIQQLHHGVMMVGGSGSGKSATWSSLLQALEVVEGVEGVSYVIDPKVMSKEALYGHLDSTTREWTDGLFTGILRKIVDNLRGESNKRHWIIFDGDVDPEWVENLNSVLDDNKLLTLPNGERLVLPPNVRILFEVETLKYATLATVSRCGMVWFNDENVSSHMVLTNYLERLRLNAFEDVDDDAVNLVSGSGRSLAVQSSVAQVIETQFVTTQIIQQALDMVKSLNHIMTFTEVRALNSFFALISKACRSILEYNAQHSDFPLDEEQIESFISKKALLALAWSFAGDCPLAQRGTFSRDVAGLTTIGLPDVNGELSIIDYDVSLPDAQWIAWQTQVPNVEVNTHSITQTDVVIPTLDTVRHEDVLYAWLSEHKPLILCGPPGSGKTMTLFSALRKLPDMEVVGLNFSSATTPDLLLKSFEQHCEYRKTLNGVVLSPPAIGRWLVIFCDEINLPAQDKYGTQRVISFMRQLVEQNGFYRTSDGAWVTLDRIQFVGACNPPTDAGRVPLGLRFLRHAPLVMVDYPGKASLQQIYGTFNSAVMKILPSLRGHASALTEAMVQLYAESQTRFTPQIQPHYIYSPRELTRWVRGLYEAIRPLEHLDLEGLVRIWAHEALRLFQDRLIGEDERAWTQDAVRRIALEHFPTIDAEKALGGPILFSSWLSKNYVPVDRDRLRDYMKERLRTFCEEEVDVPLILYDDALDHVLRIDRVFRQPQGHVILIGVSGSGKTTLSRFVAWINGLRVFQVRVHGKYTAEDFDEDLRDVLRRCGTKGEKLCFIMDESNVLDSAFLERMNTLLANAEVPGLFEGDEFAALMTACREGAQRQGLLLDSQDELYRWFTQQIAKNLHVVFTMNPPEDGLSSRAATSPALFNRCVLNWLGDWSDQTLFQVGRELTQSLDLDRPDFKAPETIQLAYRDLDLPPSHRDTIVNAMVFIHHSIHGFNRRLYRQQGRATYLTPRHFLDFVSQYNKLYNRKREDLEDQQRHLNVGLEQLKETAEKVKELRRSLAGKKAQLQAKDKEANEKLQSMFAQQKEAEKSQAVALEVQGKLEREEKEVAERKQIVLGDLAKAEPAVLEAQKSVQNIKRQQLTEVRSMGNPPQGVKLAMEAVCTLLGHKLTDWKSIQAIVRRDDFIATIINYDNDKQMTASNRNKMRREYLSSDDFTYDKVNRASKACGPLVQWVTAQVNYSEILDRVGPMRAEVDELEEQALVTKANARAIEDKLRELEESIAQYKSEYATLVNDSQAIRTEMNKVESKVKRSLHLLDSLQSERKRWEEGSKGFQTQIETIVGDTLAAAAFVAYGGLYDQQYRKAMLEDWLHHLSLSGIQFKPHNPMTEYLSTADERVQWQEHSLPVDDLCTENAIMLKDYNRYPLIIDPSGRIPTFLQQQCQDRRLTITSFLDDNFVKQVESALRFGNPILVQDAEHMDPILNNVLNREYQRTGGRVLIQLGKQEIDFSPSFSLFLSTRDPSASFAPDVCSRTTLVNFTVTQSSLQTQSLNDVLKSERPDVDERRSNLIKMQGEFNVHLRRLEKQLLAALNESKGNILDNDAVVETLETVKKEVGTITTKVAEADGVMAEVEQITAEYKVIAHSCSAIFSVLEQLRHVNHFYQFSLEFFTNIFESVLTEANLSGGSAKDHKTRVDSIVKSLFVTTFRRTSMTLLQKDRMTLAMLLGQAAPSKLDKGLFDALMHDDAIFEDVSSSSSDSSIAIQRACSQAVLSDSLKDVQPQVWESFAHESLAEQHTPIVTNGNSPALDTMLQSLLVTKMVRADRLVPAAEQFVVALFGEGLLDVPGDLNELVDQVSSTTPIAICCSPGFDASFRVDNVIERHKVRCANIAMGSNEGMGSADKAISEAASSGSWVFVKNVHLALTWLQTLEKRLGSLKPHADFRLFLSMETTPKIPVNLLRMSRVVMCEQPAGIRANMKDSLIPSADRATKAPAERSRLYLLLSLLNGIIQERLRYAPTLGWSAHWEFNDSDYECSAFVLDTWIQWAANDRSNIAPSKIPWEMIRALVVETYGGKIDNDKDFQRLVDLVEGLLVPATFEDSFDILSAVAMNKGSLGKGQSFMLPSSTGWKEFEHWVGRLPEREPPAYLGLPADAEKLLLVEHGKEMIGNMKKVMSILDESDQIMADAEAEVH